MAMSRVLATVRRQYRGLASGPASPESDTPDGLDRSRAALWPAAKGAGNGRSSWLTSDHAFEAELERPIRPQVVAGHRSRLLSRRDVSRKSCVRVLVAPTLEAPETENRRKLLA